MQVPGALSLDLPKAAGEAPASAESAPLDRAYLQHFEANINAITKLDHILTESLKLSVLASEMNALEKRLASSDEIAASYVDRVTTEEILLEDTGAPENLSLDTGSTRGLLDEAVIAARAQLLEECASARVDADLKTSAKKTQRSFKRTGAADAKDSKRRKTDDPDATEEFDANNSHVQDAKDPGRLRIRLSLKDCNMDAAMLSAEPASSSATSSKDGKVSPSKTREMKSMIKLYDNTFLGIWRDLSRKDGPKVSRLMQQSNQARLINMRKTAVLASREAKRWQMKSNKNQKDLTSKARRAMREMFNFWKRNERIERDARKKHEKDLIDKAKKEEEDRESRRQSRKLNFLITQTELYSHFISKKIKTDEIEGSDADPRFKDTPENQLDKYHGVEGKQTDINSLDFDSENEEELHKAAAANAQNALNSAKSRAETFDDSFRNPDTNGEEMNFQDPTMLGDLSAEQPKMLKCTLKEYQIKGLNWLANLYEQGINGILADEMGLGKTVQSISVLSYLAEAHNIWGPFLVVTPASTLHNWQQEISKFVPGFKVLPYWGSTKDRKILRKFWDRKSLRYGKDAPFHVLVTSYQLVVADAAYFQKMKWQYMILDEAQAIKSSQSSRWKSLLSFSCRNRLLLTGTPIQNSMQELWALLHFIMPSLFDSHDEFSDWFSKDIESHAQSNTQLNEEQLKRLHVILKPFMLRRVKKNVQSELGDKLEIDIYCDLTNRQKKYYQMLKSQISLVDLLTNSGNDENNQSLMNLVMQFRKVCNHPDLFERADVHSSFAFGKFAETGSFLRETELEVAYTLENSIGFEIPRRVYDDLLVPSMNNTIGTRNKIMEKFSIYNPENVLDDNLHNFGWLEFTDTSPSEFKKLSTQNVIERAIDRREYTDINYGRLNRFKYMYGDSDGFVPKHCQFLITELENNFCLVTNSTHLKELHSIPLKNYEEMYLNVQQPAAKPTAVAAPVVAKCSSYSFTQNLNSVLFDQKIKSSLLPLTLNFELGFMEQKMPVSEYPKSDMLPTPVNKLMDYSNIRMPSMTRFITESGKLARLDKLLDELKQNDHRVLVYFQMTKMMDLMEEFLTFRQHNYIRLDGSSKLEDRRDLVHDWQTKPEIFVFLLSTRAGGLGINLTAADTVIFYDSDWNPTIDSQAMDRAHRLGQTRQVTVYRLLTKGTIEERMRDRAKQKEQVQQVVMEGKASFAKKKDDSTSKKKDVAYLLLGGGDEVPDTTSTGSVTPRDEPLNNTLEAMYHEGEPDFSGTITPSS
ncbi:hypothetical protein METBIDRAFT_47628 [Metschnikowia bicuspidata var. bicuspidata NRRL YB-4993]|uniref:Chromatin-remodeling ATPase INO80 n=1 Tax=Metschnikowia bicuspidata var. bicuspidata NRRL YB-4993 TaxID=869754 RepID=A0A1A0H1X6_9ASCO|nr:hypothetical protein METBIDRAFT_47628 [Metschnikowia bicuspidata var. bicuspidata NRRL YB-4993]OBA17963.1 hypothetical protein METBIDRAFT_47628 [Metschnikowia bicuspidata var. bicuspidata NRRL YB-4993]